jgi:hypothetical protein
MRVFVHIRDTLHESQNKNVHGRDEAGHAESSENGYSILPMIVTGPFAAWISAIHASLFVPVRLPRRRGSCNLDKYWRDGTCEHKSQ